jgi:hypothetical protein
MKPVGTIQKLNLNRFLFGACGDARPSMIDLTKKLNRNKYLAATLVLAAVGLASSARAQTSVFFAGGNASQTVLYDRATNILNGTSPSLSVIISPTNSTVRTYTGSIAGETGLGTVTINFSLLGAIQGLEDVGQNSEIVASGGSLVPTVAVSSADPLAVGINSAPFTQIQTLVVPYAYIKNPPLSANLANVTNLTQRQAAYFEGAAGTLPSAFFGGASSNDAVYLIPRNTASAVRTEIDANIYFTGSISAWTSNGINGQAVYDPNGGQSSGTAVKNVLKTVTNAIGTVAASDIGTFTTLAYEGVPFSIANVENGSYPFWGYERWVYPSPGQQGTPSANQLIVINALLSAVTNATYQTTSTVFVGNFAPLQGLQVQRLSDGGPITSLLY